MSPETPVFVISPGRSGSSSVARVLHEHLGIYMGKYFAKPDEANPNGYYEDLAFKTFNGYFIENRVSEQSWITTVRKIIQKRKDRGEPWGIKDPRMCYLLPQYFLLCPQAILLRCRRNLVDVAKSCERWYGWDSRIVEERSKLLDQYTKEKKVIEIDMNEHKDDSWIISQLRGRLNNG